MPSTVNRGDIFQIETGNHIRATSLDIDLQASDRGTLLATLSRSSRESLGQNPETSQRPLTVKFLKCDRFSNQNDRTGDHTQEQALRK